MMQECILYCIELNWIACFFFFLLANSSRDLKEQEIELQRNEVIALINGLRQLSLSVLITRDYVSELVESGEIKPARPLPAQLAMNDGAKDDGVQLSEAQVDQKNAKRDFASSSIINKHNEL